MGVSKKITVLEPGKKKIMGAEGGETETHPVHLSRRYEKGGRFEEGVFHYIREYLSVPGQNMESHGDERGRGSQPRVTLRQRK